MLQILLKNKILKNAKATANDSFREYEDRKIKVHNFPFTDMFKDKLSLGGNPTIYGNTVS